MGGHGDGKRKREGCLFPLTVCWDARLRMSKCVFSLPEVSGSLLQLVSLLWKSRQVPAGGRMGVYVTWSHTTVHACRCLSTLFGSDGRWIQFG